MPKGPTLKDRRALFLRWCRALRPGKVNAGQNIVVAWTPVRVRWSDHTHTTDIQMTTAISPATRINRACIKESGGLKCISLKLERNPLWPVRRRHLKRSGMPLSATYRVNPINTCMAVKPIAQVHGLDADRIIWWGRVRTVLIAFLCQAFSGEGQRGAAHGARLWHVPYFPRWPDGRNTRCRK